MVGCRAGPRSGAATAPETWRTLSFRLAARKAKLSSAFVDAVIEVMSADDYDAERLDAIAAEQRRQLEQQGVLEPAVKAVIRLKCQACLCNIGPGFYEQEVWYDTRTRRWICRGCAHWRPEQGRYRRIATKEELAVTEVGPLSRLLLARSRQLEGGS